MDRPSQRAPRLRITAVIPAHNRPKALARVLDRLSEQEVDEIVVVDNGSAVDLSRVVLDRGARYVRSDVNVGVRARNLGAATATGDLLLMLDDDSYPQASTVAAMSTQFDMPELGALGGRVVDLNPSDPTFTSSGEEIGSFDWFSRHAAGDAGADQSMPAFLFAEGASMIRRKAYHDVGGCFEPYFGEVTELDLATRLIAAGWDVRYMPTAVFDHLRSEEWRGGLRHDLRLRVRNQVWYFYRHFPWPLAVRRIAHYLVFDLIECGYRGMLDSWVGGVSDAWRQRQRIRGTRRTLPRTVIQRAELRRGRAHVALLMQRSKSKLGIWRAAKEDCPSAWMSAFAEWLRSLPARVYAYVFIRIDRWVHDRKFHLPPAASRRIEVRAVGAEQQWRGDYLGSPWGILRRAMPSSEVDGSDVFLDLGCGFGRVVIQAARMPFRRVIGIEVVTEIADAAREAINANRGRLVCQDVEIIDCDVRDYEIPDDVTVVYLYEPFPNPMVEQVVGEVDQSVERTPREVKLISFSDYDLTQLPHVRLSGFGRRRVFRFLRDRDLRIYSIGHASPVRPLSRP